MPSDNHQNLDQSGYEMQEVNHRKHRRSHDRTHSFFYLDYSRGSVDSDTSPSHNISRSSRPVSESRRLISNPQNDSRMVSDYTDDSNEAERSDVYQEAEYNNPFDTQYALNDPNHFDYSDVYGMWGGADQLEDIGRQHRTISMHRHAAVKDVSATVNRTYPRSLETRRKWLAPPSHVLRQTSLEQRATNIASRMEQDSALMEDTPESEQLRREALRDMPQCLTVKRIIRKKLVTSVSQHSKHKPISIFKRLKYRASMRASKISNWFKSLAYSFELWYSSLKTIEGHFGSGVATHFKFFRWLFIMNALIVLFVTGFVTIPQLLYVHINLLVSANDTQETLQANNSNNSVAPQRNLFWKNFRQNSFENSEPFHFYDIFTGEGYFTNTSLYYGFYTNKYISIIPGQSYSMPYAYFFTMFCVYLTSFIVLSTSMARSYRRSFIETQGGLKNVFAHKVFCGWDYSIATIEAANLKSASIYHELKELLSDSIKKSVKVSLLHRFWTFIIQIVANVIIFIKLLITGYVMWYLLERHVDASATKDEKSSLTTLLAMAVVINLIMIFFPILFSFIVRYEDYKNPRAALYITLIRTFLLKVVVVGVFLAFWLIHSAEQMCWETSIGQHIYRLILFDFLFSVLITTAIEAARYFIYKKFRKSIGTPHFDIAKYTLNLMYNQTLLWVGLFFSPLLAAVVLLKLWCTWYLRRTCLLRFCQPSSRSWRAAQTQTWFLILSFLSLLLVLIAHGYIIVRVSTSECGPFKDYPYIYEIVLKGVFQLEQNNKFWKILMYLLKPGTVALILVAMCVVVYYLRAKAFAHKSMINILRNMLVLEAKDKEFLLKNISKVTEGREYASLLRLAICDSTCLQSGNITYRPHQRWTAGIIARKQSRIMLLAMRATPALKTLGPFLRAIALAVACFCWILMMSDIKICTEENIKLHRVYHRRLILKPILLLLVLSLYWYYMKCAQLLFLP